MKRPGTLGVGMAGAVVAAFALLIPPVDCRAYAADASSAHEVPAGTLGQSPSRAREVPNKADEGSAVRESINAWRGPDSARVDGAEILLDPQPDPNQDTVSELYERLFLKQYYESVSTDFNDSVPFTRDPYDYVERAAEMSPARWKFSGEIGFSSGDSTYGDNEGQEFALREKLDTGTRTYEFYQEHNVDHSYVSSAETVIGAKQRFERWLWEGDLRLQEEFTQYKDRNDGANNRQEGRFDLDFRPKFNDGKTELLVEYGYRIKEYEEFSPRSYKHNSGRIRLTQHLSDDLTASAQLRMENYDYSLGSTRGNRRVEASTEWEYKASDDLRFSASLESEQKTYSARKTRDYEELKTRLSAVWQPDADSMLNASVQHTDHVATFSPSKSYDDTTLTASYQRQLTDELSATISATERGKSFSTQPDDDLDQHSQSLVLSYNYCQAWTFGLNLARDEYAYVSPARAYTTNRAGLSASYYCDGVNYSADYSRTENDYSSDGLRDYTNDTWSLGAGWKWERSRLNLSYSYSLLDQADPASFNDYNDQAFSGEWRYEINPDTDFSLNYTSSQRSYDAQPSVDDTRVEAKLEFEL